MKELVDSEFKQFITDNSIALVDFGAAWCGPCRVMNPIVEALANEQAGKAGVAKMDCDNNSEIPSEYGVRSLPTFIFFKDGKEVNRIVGATQKDKLEASLKEVMAS